MDNPSSPVEAQHFAYPQVNTNAETQRLETGHRLLSEWSGLLYHPSLGDLSQFDNILETCAGPGIWCMDLLAGGLKDKQPVNLRPGCRVSASDITDIHFPKKHSPGIAGMFTHNVLDSFPEDKQGVYDLIHQRFLLGGVTEAQWSQVLSNLKDGLRPGGFIHLHEAKPIWISRSGEALPVAFQWWNEIVNAFFGFAQRHLNLTEALPSMVSSAGFTSIHHLNLQWPIGATGRHISPAYPSRSLANYHTVFTADGPFVQMAKMPIAKQAENSVVDEVKRLPSVDKVLRVHDDVMREADVNGGWSPMVMVVGQKPVAANKGS